MLRVQADTAYVTRRALDRFGYFRVSFVVLYHAKPAVTASSRSEVRAANMPRCRKKGVVNNKVSKTILFTTPVWLL